MHPIISGILYVCAVVLLIVAGAWGTESWWALVPAGLGMTAVYILYREATDD